MDRPPIWVLLKPLLTVHVMPAQKAGGAIPLPVPLPSNHTVAVDPRVIPYGSKLLINGVVYTAEDKGGAVRGNHIDIFFDTHGETRMYGTQSADVYLLS